MRKETKVSRLFGAAALLTLSVSVASACEILAPPTQSIDPDERRIDREPPSKVVAVLSQVEPGDGWELESGAGFCKGDAFARIKLEVTDNRTSFDDIGFTVRVTAGDPPEGMYMPKRPILSSDGSISLMWTVGRPPRIPPVDFTVEITATDLAGNEGPPSEPIRIQHGWIDN